MWASHYTTGPGPVAGTVEVGHNVNGWRLLGRVEERKLKTRGQIKVGWIVGEERKKQEKWIGYGDFQGKEIMRKAKWLIRNSWLQVAQ